MEHLSIEFTEITEWYLKAKMPVNSSVHQPMGRLHGGASVVLIESIASMGSALLLDLKKESPVGLEVNANHISGIKTGTVIGTGKPIHIGKKTHIWQVEIHDEVTDKLICSGRITIMIISSERG